MHEAQQANLATQATRQRRQQDRQANRILSRAGQPANHNAAGAPASSPAMDAAMQRRLSHLVDSNLVIPPWSVRCASGQRQRRLSPVTATS
eukprot:4881097-Pyramimonas_sp.AAC.1